MPNYDYIIIGAGASGLLLADALGQDDFFKDKSILVLDRSDKTQNDRTWCFWEAPSGQFDPLLSKIWPTIRFAGRAMNENIDIAPYQYKMLRGSDFYKHYLNRIASYVNIHFIQESVKATKAHDAFIEVLGAQNNYQSSYVFDSRFEYGNLLPQSKYPVLQQHFLGWFIKTNQSVFNTKVATFMDFSIPQKGNTRFMYVLPLSENEGLVEYTLFSASPLKKVEYEMAIKMYVEQDLGAETYEIMEVEQGNIPMTSFDFTKENTDRYLKIGVAGGWAKASTGYTFYSSVKKVQQLKAFLKTKKPLSSFPKKNRFWFYDLLFLDVLYQNNHLGSEVFESMFRKCKTNDILQFLDEDTTFWQELKIIWACPKLPFIKALFRRLFSFKF